MTQDYRNIIECIDAEVAGAQRKFPGNKHMLAALMEEVGEVAQALLDHSRGKASREEIYTECVQVAAMAIRLALEGSAEFPYAYDPESYENFVAT